MSRARQLEADEQARPQRASFANETLGVFTDGPEDGAYIPGASEQDETSLFTYDLDGDNYRDDFTDDEDEDIFRHAGSDEEQGIGLKLQDRTKISEQRLSHSP